MFKAIKNLPEKKDYDAINMTNKFQMALLGIAHKSIKKGWNRMVGIWLDGDEIKRREMLGLVEKTNSKEY